MEISKSWLFQSFHETLLVSKKGTELVFMFVTTLNKSTQVFFCYRFSTLWYYSKSDKLDQNDKTLVEIKVA